MAEMSFLPIDLNIPQQSSQNSAQVAQTDAKITINMVNKNAKNLTTVRQNNKIPLMLNKSLTIVISLISWVISTSEYLIV